MTDTTTMTDYDFVALLDRTREHLDNLEALTDEELEAMRAAASLDVAIAEQANEDPGDRLNELEHLEHEVARRQRAAARTKIAVGEQVRRDAVAAEEDERARRLALVERYEALAIDRRGALKAIDRATTALVKALGEFRAAAIAMEAPHNALDNSRPHFIADESPVHDWVRSRLSAVAPRVFSGSERTGGAPLPASAAAVDAERLSSVDLRELIERDDVGTEEAAPVPDPIAQLEGNRDALVEALAEARAEDGDAARRREERITHELEHLDWVIKTRAQTRAAKSAARSTTTNEETQP